MPTNASASTGTLLKKGDGGSPESFTTIAEVLDLPHPPRGSDEYEATSHDSPQAFEEVILGIKRTGEMAVPINWIPGHATHQALDTEWQNQTLSNYQMVIPTTGSPTFAFSAFVKNIGGQSPVAGKLAQTVTFRISGPITLTY